jgi:hypothetical protein
MQTLCMKEGVGHVRLRHAAGRMRGIKSSHEENSWRVNQRKADREIHAKERVAGTAVDARIMSGSTVGSCRRLLLGSTIGFCWDRPSALAGIDRKL